MERRPTDGGQYFGDQGHLRLLLYGVVQQVEGDIVVWKKGTGRKARGIANGGRVVEKESRRK
jgi:hypothetical protein